MHTKKPKASFREKKRNPIESCEVFVGSIWTRAFPYGGVYACVCLCVCTSLLLLLPPIVVRKEKGVDSGGYWWWVARSTGSCATTTTTTTTLGDEQARFPRKRKESE